MARDEIPQQLWTSAALQWWHRV